MNGAPAPQVRAMFARIAPTYDLLNRLLSAGRDRVWRRVVASGLTPGSGRVLDLCAGTGDLALEIARQHPAASIVAGDFCLEMLQRGAAKGLNGRAAPLVCDGLRLPFRAASFDAVTVAFGVRNFEDLAAGLAEICRVLRPGGILAVLEFFRSESRWKDLPFRLYFGQVLPLVGRLISHDRQAYTYLPQSVGRFVTRREFDASLGDAGFESIRHCEMDGGIATLVQARRAAGQPSPEPRTMGVP